MKDVASVKYKKKNKAGEATGAKDLEDPKIHAEKEAMRAGENQDGGRSTSEKPDQERETGKEGEEEEEKEDRKMDSEIKVSVEETCKREDGGEFRPEHKGGRENGEEEEEKETIEEKNKESPQEREDAQTTEEPLENGEVASDVEPDKERAEEDHMNAVEVVVVVNGLREEDEMEDEGHHTKLPEATEAASESYSPILPLKHPISGE